MKKLIALLVCLCLMLAVFAGCAQSGTDTAAPAEAEAPEAEAAEAEAPEAEEAEAEAPAAEGASAAEAAEPDPNVPVEDDAASAEAPAETPAPPVINIGEGGTGYETYAPDTVVGTVNGQDVTWMEYYYWLRNFVSISTQVAQLLGSDVESWDSAELYELFETAYQYGLLNLDPTLLSADDTNAEVVVKLAQQSIAQDHAILTGVADMGVTLSEEDEAQIQAVLEQNADTVTGDGDGTATQEELDAFQEYLADEMFVDEDFFRQFVSVDVLGQQGFNAASGEMGQDLSDEEALAFAAENGIMAAKHILILTVDPDTREPLAEDQIAEKLAIAEGLNEQLQAVKDDQEAMIALFDQLMAENTEDSGYANYPDGYVFSAGEMVQEFEDAVRSLDENYGLSEIVESPYGYHIILRIPVDPDGIVGTDANGNNISLRYAAASQLFNQQVQSWIDNADAQWNEEFQAPDMEAIFG